MIVNAAIEVCQLCIFLGKHGVPISQLDLLSSRSFSIQLLLHAVVTESSVITGELNIAASAPATAG